MDQYWCIIINIKLKPILDSYLLSVSIASFSPGSHPGHHMTFSCHVYLGSFDCISFSDFLCFLWSWQLWWVKLVRYIVLCLPTRICLMFILRLDGSYRFFRSNTTEIQHHFVTSYQGYTLLWFTWKDTWIYWFITVSFDLDHTLRFCHISSFSLPLFYTVLFRKKLCNPCE